MASFLFQSVSENTIIYEILSALGIFNHPEDLPKVFEINKEHNYTTHQKSRLFKSLLDFCENKEEKIKGLQDKYNELYMPNDKEFEAYETNVLYLIHMNIQAANKVLLETLNEKEAGCEARIECIERKIRGNTDYFEEFSVVKGLFFEQNQRKKAVFSESVIRLKNLFQLELAISKLEQKFIPVEEQTKLVQVEKAFGTLYKSSLNSLKILEFQFGVKNSESVLEVPSMILKDFDLFTYESLSRSIMNSLKSLTDLEQFKANTFNTAAMEMQVLDLDKLISEHFSVSETVKEGIFSKLNRISKGESDAPLFASESIYQADIESRNIASTLELLNTKTRIFIKHAQKQEKILAKLLENLRFIENALVEIDIKFEDLISMNLKDIAKCIPISDSEHKEELENFKEFFEKTTEKGTNDMCEQVENIIKKLEKIGKIEEIRHSVREAQVKDIAKIKFDCKNQVNSLTIWVSSLEKEKNSLEESLNLLRINLEKNTQIAEKMSQNCLDKDLEISRYKNNIASLYEEISQIKELNLQLQSENDDISKDLRACKKIIREKENEITEMKSN